MNPPSRQTRIMGSPLGAIVIFILCGMFLLGWYRGTAPWWVAFIALAIALQTGSAVGQVRDYKMWRTAWKVMGSSSAPTPRKRGNKAVPLIVIVFVAMVLSNPEWAQEHAAGLILLALMVGGLFGLVMLIRRGRRKAKATAVHTPVSWLVGVASSSTSRSDAMRSLPEYSARLLS